MTKPFNEIAGEGHELLPRVESQEINEQHSTTYYMGTTSGSILNTHTTPICMELLFTPNPLDRGY